MTSSRSSRIATGTAETSADSQRRPTPRLSARGDDRVHRLRSQRRDFIAIDVQPSRPMVLVHAAHCPGAAHGPRQPQRRKA